MAHRRRGGGANSREKGNFVSVNLREFLEKYRGSGAAGRLCEAARGGGGRVTRVSGVRGSAYAAAAAALRGAAGMPEVIVCVLDDEDEAGYFFQDLKALCRDGAGVMFYPSGRRLRGGGYVKDEENCVLRTEALGKIVSGCAPLMVVSYPEAVAEKVPGRKALAGNYLKVSEGEAAGIAALEERLLRWGFRNADYVYRPGEFAVRGSIVDVFSFSSNDPFRLDFFGDEICSIRTFDIRTQLSVERRKSVVLAPQTGTSGGVPVVQLFPEDTLFIVKRPGFVAERIDIFREKMLSGKRADGAPEEESFVTGREFREFLGGRNVIVSESTGGAGDGLSVAFNTRPQPLFHKNFDLVKEAFEDYAARGYGIFVAADNPKQLERLRSILRNLNAGAAFTPVEGTVHAGFVDDELKVCLFTDHEIFDRYHRYSLVNNSVRNGHMALSLKEIKELQIGDYVVHIDHGIGKFAGLVNVGSGGNTQEMIKLIYANDDIVLVSIGSLHKLSKYKGKEGELPRLNHLGTGAWQRLKDRTKRKIKDIARDLIKLYSERQKKRGFAFSADSYLQQELEASFVYEDTPDQLKATLEVKADMEKDRPMDRLVCGDVGFGKTEVAVRAAFKAACDGKQTAVLVPTTLLAFQHFQTFSERLRDFPVKVDYLSRARTAAQAKQVLQDLRDGKTDIIIGTHKLAGKNVRFKDLGLLVIDEEQKFGVAVKERLRQMKTDVDTLTLTATPIPRTLQFSLMGARDMSAIQTPPPNRYPIETQICTFDEDVIAEAIRYELKRNGQVFFVCNKIARLPGIANFIRRRLPEARVAIGHGQMPPEQLENTMVDFINCDYDVLVTTTIIENGVDIPNVNTIIVSDAQHFGLSDLHQMRGRVGRSDKKAFCYLIAPPLSLLPDDSRRRLEAIENFTDLGSGINIAIQDLDIRGAGNLLGAEQSGFIADLGYDAYQKILNEAVTELKAQEFADLYTSDVKDCDAGDGGLFVTDCTVESDLQMCFPESYVPGASERIQLYRELDAIENDKELEAYRRRLEDRFGEPPRQAEELMRVVTLRRNGKKLGIEKILLRAGVMLLLFVSDKDSPYYQSAAFESVINYAMLHFHACKLEEANGKRRMLVQGVKSMSDAADTLAGILSSHKLHS